MTELSGKVAIITGGARGLGAAIARRYVAEGARVVLNDFGGTVDGAGSDATAVQQLVDELNSGGWKVAVANSGDIADTATGRELVASAVEEFGRLDVLVNSAGIVRDRMIFNLSEEDWDAVIRVHMRGHYSAIRPAAAYWREQRNPDGNYRILNMTSISGIEGSPGQPNYSAAKGGIVGLTYSLAHGLARYGVTANAISPGAATRITGTVPDEKRASGSSVGDDPTRSPDNLGPLAVYLASDRSSWLTGRIVSSVGYEVGIYRAPEYARQLFSDKPWEVDELATAMEKNFRPIADGLPPSFFSSQVAGK